MKRNFKETEWQTNNSRKNLADVWFVSEKFMMCSGYIWLCKIMTKKGLVHVIQNEF